MDRWTQHLFRFHSEATLREWAKRLHMFRFHRAYGGLANDGDSLLVAYEYEQVSDLHRFFDHIGIPLEMLATQPPQTEVGGTYSITDLARLPSLIPRTQWIAQPGYCSIAGEKAFVWCEEDRIRISLSTGYDVTEKDVHAGELIEKVLRDAPLARSDPPVDNEHCICPKYHPTYFD